jgi:hypothetical protein
MARRKVSQIGGKAEFGNLELWGEKILQPTESWLLPSQMEQQ